MDSVSSSIMFLSIAVANEAITTDQAKACLTVVTQTSQDKNINIRAISEIERELMLYQVMESHRIYGV